MEQSKIVVVQTFGDRLEAELVAGMLEAEGIPATVQGDTAGGMREHLAWSGKGFKVLVREEDVEAAHELLKPGERKFIDNDGKSLDAEFDGESDEPKAG
jgi:hypothetical protein